MEEPSSSSSPLLNRISRVTIRDGRVLVGVLKCFDREKNLVLTEAEEYRTPEEIETENEIERKKRQMGMIMIPGEKLCKFEVAESSS